MSDNKPAQAAPSVMDMTELPCINDCGNPSMMPISEYCLACSATQEPLTLALAPEPAQAAPDDLVARLHGPHGSGLLDRLGGAQRMHDSNMPISTWVAKEIDNEAAQWIRDAADAIARLRAELARANAQIASRWEHRTVTEERERDGWRCDIDKANKRAERAEAERDALREDAERWNALCNLWAACAVLTLTQDEDGRWSIEATEPVDSETFATLTGRDPDDAIDAARAAT
jgi:hypothetical protein